MEVMKAIGPFPYPPPKESCCIQNIWKLEDIPIKSNQRFEELWLNKMNPQAKKLCKEKLNRFKS